MSKLLFSGALAVTAALAAHPAVQAGEHRIQRVALTENTTGWFANGNVADVYNSEGNVEAISCWIRGTNYVDGFCFARDEKGKTLQCATMEEPKLRAIAAIGSDSTVQFGILRGEGKCGVIVVTNGSYSGPKRHPTPESDTSAIDITGSQVLQ